MLAGLRINLASTGWSVSTRRSEGAPSARWAAIAAGCGYDGGPPRWQPCLSRSISIINIWNRWSAITATACGDVAADRFIGLSLVAATHSVLDARAGIRSAPSRDDCGGSTWGIGRWVPAGIPLSFPRDWHFWTSLYSGRGRGIALTDDAQPGEKDDGRPDNAARVEERSCVAQSATVYHATGDAHLSRDMLAGTSD